MYAEISNNAVPFYKALQDIWCAEQTFTGSPNNAVWSCCQAVGFIHNLARYDQRLRYKSLRSDPSVEEAKDAITDTKSILHEFDEHPKCSAFIKEAKEVYDKLLTANTETLFI